MSVNSTSQQKQSQNIKPFFKGKKCELNAIDQTQSGSVVFNQMQKISSCARMNSLEQENKAKIMQLQDELLKAKKEMTLKECHFAKQKSNLLNKIQMLCMENTEIKQRQSNLQQINQTLTLALQSKNSNETKKQNIQSDVIKKMENELKSKDKTICDQRIMIQNYKKKQEQESINYQNQLRDKQAMICQLQQQIRQGERQNFDNIEKIKQVIGRLCNENIFQMIFKPSHKNDRNMDNILDKLDSQSFQNFQSDESFPQILAQSNEYQKRKNGMNKKFISLNRYEKDNSRPSNSKFNPNISHISKNKSSFIHKHENSDIFSESSIDQLNDYQPDKYLCEICNKVYDEYEFKAHMPQCQDLDRLHQQKKKIENAISQIEIEDRRISKSKTPLKQINTNRNQKNMDHSKRHDLSQRNIQNVLHQNNIKCLTNRNSHSNKESGEQIKKIISELNYQSNQRNQHQVECKNMEKARYPRGAYY